MNMTVIRDIYPLPILEIKIPKKFISIVPLLNKYGMVKDLQTEISGEVSHNSYILNDSKFKFFKNFILEKINYYGYEVLGLNSQNYQITQSWVSIKKSNKHHSAHVHSNSIISGVFFFGKKDKNTPGLNLISPYRSNPSGNNFSLKVPLRPNYNEGLLSSLHYTIPFQPGLMVLFPSFVGHSVDISQSQLPRKSLAFNAVPKEGFGLEEGLNECKIMNYDNE